MEIDSVLHKVLTEVQTEIKEEEGIDISIQEIGEIVESQFTAANLAFKKGLGIRLPLWGTFVRKHGIEKGLEAQELNSIKDTMTKEQYERRVLEAKLRNIEKAKERRQMPRISFSELKSTPDLVNLNNKFDKIVK